MPSNRSIYYGIEFQNFNILHLTSQEDKIMQNINQTNFKPADVVTLASTVERVTNMPISDMLKRDRISAVNRIADLADSYYTSQSSAWRNCEPRSGRSTRRQTA